MPAKKFLDLLEQQGFLDPSIISDLRKQVTESSIAVSPEVIAKKLVDSGHLTKFQATKLVGQAKEGAASQGKRKKKRRADDEIVLLEDASEAPQQPTQKPKKQQRQKPAQQRPVQQRPVQQQPVQQQPQGLQPLGGLDPLGGADPLADPSAGLAGVDDMLDEPSAGGSPLAPQKKKGWFGGGGRKKQQSVGYQKPAARPDNVWDTKLILVGGAALLLLLVVGTSLFYSLTRGTAQELFNEAERDYNQGSYGQAMDKFNRFLRQYKNDENVSLARVRIGMCRIWQNANDPQAALEMAIKVLPEIEPEESFDNAREELASVLPEIARKFSVRAESAPKTSVAAENVEKAEQAMVLVDNPSYVPTSLKQQVQGKINQIKETLDLVRHVIGRENKLVKAMSDIDAASGAGDMKLVYEIRDNLLADYPGLEANDELRQQLLKVSARERTLVKLSEATLETSQDEHPEQGNEVVMAVNNGGTVTGVDLDIVLVRAAGVVYGVNAKDGQMLWRRFVGDAASNPVRASVEVDANVLLNDAKHNEVVCLQPRTGKLIWRTAIGEPFFGPEVSVDEQIVVTAAGGSIYKLDAATGAGIKKAASPLPVRVHATVQTRRAQIYQLADHTNIYVHAASDTDKDGEKHEALECREVFYLGHKAGSVVTAPVVQLGFLFIAENKGPEDCDLHILRLDAEGLGLRKAQPPIRLRGRVVVEPVLANRRLVVTTDLGSIYVLDVDPSAMKSPVTDAVEPLQVDRSEAMISYALVDKAQLWIGDNRLTRYNVQVAKSELSRRWVKLPGDVFRFPIQRVGNAVVHVRTKQGAAGVTVSAVNGETGDPIWQTSIGASAGAAFFTPAGKLRAVSSAGRLYEAADGANADLVGDASGDGLGGAFLHSLDMGDGQLAVCSLSDRRRFLVVNTDSNEIAQHRMETAAEPTADLAFAAGGLAAGLANGEVVLIDPKTGQNLVRPFYPTVAAGDQVRWFAASPAGANGKEFLITDNRKNIYRLAPSMGNVSYLEELSHATLNQQIVSRAVAIGEQVFVAVRGMEPEFDPAAPKKKEDAPKEVRIGDEILPWNLSVCGRCKRCHCRDASYKAPMSWAKLRSSFPTSKV